MKLPVAVLHSWKENKHFVCEAFDFVPCMLGTAWAQMCLKFLLSQLLICTFWAFTSAKQMPGRVLDMITVFIRETGIMQWMICETRKNKWFVPFQLCASRCHEMLPESSGFPPRAFPLLPFSSGPQRMAFSLASPWVGFARRHLEGDWKEGRVVAGLSGVWNRDAEMKGGWKQLDALHRWDEGENYSLPQRWKYWFQILCVK